MSSYTPEHVYGLIPGTYDQYGLIPWPKHLQPRYVESLEQSSSPASGGSGVELTKKGEAYVAAALANAGGTFFLTLDRNDRVSIATTIERLIDMLDAIDLDPDLEDGADNEPWLGWTRHGAGLAAGEDAHDDREGDDEREWDQAEDGIADDDALRSEEFGFGSSGDGSGVSIARNLLRRVPLSCHR